MKTLKKTGISFESGQKLTASDLQKLNNTVNNIVDAVNLMLKGKVDLNIELGDTEKTYSLKQAIEAAKNIRRELGQKIRFRALSGNFVEYSYIGKDLSDMSWSTEDNWTTSLDLIDGGEF